MVKGVSRQVIVLHSPDPALFDQAIFILRNDAIKNGVTEDALMKEAKQLLHSGKFEKKRQRWLNELLFIGAGAAFTGMIWLITALI